MNLCLPYTPCLVHPLWIITWKFGWPCVSLHVCPSHLIFVPTPCLECVHASLHEFMSSWLLMCGPPPMHSLIETWVHLYGSVFVCQSCHFCCHTLFRMCTYISTCIHLPWWQQLSARKWGVWLGFCSNTGKIASWLESCLFTEVAGKMILPFGTCDLSYFQSIPFLHHVRLSMSYLPSLPINHICNWPFSFYLSLYEY